MKGLAVATIVLMGLGITGCDNHPTPKCDSNEAVALFNHIVGDPLNRQTAPGGDFTVSLSEVTELNTRDTPPIRYCSGVMTLYSEQTVWGWDIPMDYFIRKMSDSKGNDDIYLEMNVADHATQDEVDSWFVLSGVIN